MKATFLAAALTTITLLSGCATNGYDSASKSFEATVVGGEKCQPMSTVENGYNLCAPLRVTTNDGKELDLPMHTKADVGETVIIQCDDNYNCHPYAKRG